MNLSVVRFVDRRIGVPLVRLLGVLVRAGRKPARDREPQRILIMRGFGIGNLVLMLPTLKALRDRYPSARIDAITLRSNRGFLERTGWFERVWYLDDRSLIRFLGSFAGAVPRLLRVRYDLYVDFEQFARTSAILGLLLLIPRRVGYLMPGKGRESAFTDIVPFRQELHMMDGFYTLLQPLGIPAATGLAPVPVPTTADEERAADRLLEEAGVAPGGRFAVIHPGSGPNMTLRRWPEANYAAIADKLADQGYRIVLTGVRSEADIVARVAGAMTHMACNAVGRLTLGELLAVLRRASLVLTNDTGPIHLAAAQGAPVVGLYGPNTPQIYGPRGPLSVAFYLGLPCSPCMTNASEKESDCQNNICMKLMTVEQVAVSLFRMLEGHPTQPSPAGGVRPIPGDARRLYTEPAAATK